MELRKGSICSGQTCLKKAPLILWLMDVMTSSTWHPLLSSRPLRIPRLFPFSYAYNSSFYLFFLFFWLAIIELEGVEDDGYEYLELIDLAMKGMLNVLKSCAKAKSVRRVVLASSMATVAFTGQPVNADDLLNETWFSVPNVCEELETLAEKAAWKFAEENGLDLVTTNVGCIFGPPLQPTINFSVGIILDLFKGPTYPNGYVIYVDVRDVANAHIQAFEIASANGRYGLVDSSPHFSDIIKIIRESFPNLKLAEKYVIVVVNPSNILVAW
ncbi:hypothetical protein Ancab_032659 [Ancistrocladus abbreviatus]